MTQQLFRGQGKVKVYPVNSAGAVSGGGKFLGNVTELSFSPQVEKLEHQESTSGKRAVDKTITTSRKVAMSMVGEDFSTGTLAISFQGAASTKAAGNVTAEVFPAGLVAGDEVALANVDISNLVITDSSAVPVELDLDVHYTIDSAAHGSIVMLDVTGFTQPFKAAYDHGASESVDVMSGRSKTYELRFEGLNTAEDDRAVLVRARVQLEPGQQLSLIGDQFGNYTVNGDVLFFNGKFADVTYVGA